MRSPWGIALSAWVALSATVSATAQTVWQVLPTEAVQPYVDRAAPGDRIELLPWAGVGITRDMRIDKTLQVVGLSPASSVRSIVVADLPRGATVTLSNIPTMGISLLRCAGTVVLDRIRVSEASWGGCSIDGCASVLMSNCSFWGSHRVLTVTGSSGAWIRDSVVRAVACEFFATADQISGAYPGIRMWTSHVELESCLAMGVPSFEWYDSGCWCVRRSAATPGVAGSGTLVLTAGSELLSGRSPGGVATDVDGWVIRTEDTRGSFINQLGRMRVIPNQPRLHAPTIVARASLFTTTVEDRPDTLALLFADMDAGPPVTLGDFPLPIGLTSAAVLMSLGLTDATGSVTLPAAVPADPSFHHRALYLQAVVGQPIPLRYGVSAIRAVLTD